MPERALNDLEKILYDFGLTHKPPALKHGNEQATAIVS